MKITRFEDIESWKLARKLTNALYSMTNKSSFSADYALKDQIRRAAGSVMHNIAEGFDAGSRGEFARFLRYAQRSCTEVQSQLYLAVDQNYLTESEFCVLHTQAAQTRKKIGGFIRYLTEDGKSHTARTNPRN